MDGLEEKGLTFEVNGKSYTSQELLVYWIQERETIRKLKENGAPKPWSDDPVFQRTYFCNVHREDDKVTRWIRANYTIDFFGQGIDTAMVAARLFNLPSTLQDISNYFSPYKGNVLASHLEEMKKAKKQIWGGAYLITTHGQKMSKIDYCVEVIGMADDILPINTETCAEMWRHLMQVKGLGSFLSAQVVADLKNTVYHPLQEAPDKETFSASGPGSLRGLQWFHELEKVSPVNYHKLIGEVEYYLRSQAVPQMDMQDLQNCLCEFDKYCRVSKRTGRSKRKYNGG